MGATESPVNPRSGLHIGVTPWQWSGAAGIAHQAALAEEMGFDSFWLPENHFQGPTAFPDPLMVLSAAAVLTGRITLATTSYLLPLRSPLQAAEQIAVLDNLSEGRLLLGLGRGYDRETLAAFGVKAGSKRALFASHLEEIIALLSGAPIPGCAEQPRLAPAVVQVPYPPFVVAAFGPKAIAQAGSFGLPYLVSCQACSVAPEGRFPRGPWRRCGSLLNWVSWWRPADGFFPLPPPGLASVPARPHLAKQCFASGFARPARTLPGGPRLATNHVANAEATEQA